MKRLAAHLAAALLPAVIGIGMVLNSLGQVYPNPLVIGIGALLFSAAGVYALVITIAAGVRLGILEAQPPLRVLDTQPATPIREDS